jgi:hypothetical protein
VLVDTDLARDRSPAAPQREQARGGDLSRRQIDVRRGSWVCFVISVLRRTFPHIAAHSRAPDWAWEGPTRESFALVRGVVAVEEVVAVAIGFVLSFRVCAAPSRTFANIPAHDGVADATALDRSF